MELLRDLIAKRLLPLDPVWFLERGDIEPPFLFLAVHHRRCIVDKARNEPDIGPVCPAFRDIHHRSVIRHIDVRSQTSRGSVGCQRTAGIASSRHAQFRDPKLLRHRNRKRHSPRLEGTGWIECLILQPEISEARSRRKPLHPS